MSVFTQIESGTNNNNNYYYHNIFSLGLAFEKGTQVCKLENDLFAKFVRAKKKNVQIIEKCAYYLRVFPKITVTFHMVEKSVEQTKYQAIPSKHALMKKNLKKKKKHTQQNGATASFLPLTVHYTLKYYNSSTQI